MPIKWSALAVTEAMDEIQELLNQAEPFLAEAQAKAGKATGISNLPQYMSQRVHRLIYTIEARDRIKDCISGVLNCIPQDAIEADRQAGKQQGLEL